LTIYLNIFIKPSNTLQRILRLQSEWSYYKLHSNKQFEKFVGKFQTLVYQIEAEKKSETSEVLTLFQNNGGDFCEGYAVCRFSSYYCFNRGIFLL